MTEKSDSGNKWLKGRTQYIFDYALENWYNELKDITFKSEIIPLEKETLQSLQKGCDFFRENEKSKIFSEDEDELAKLIIKKEEPLKILAEKIDFLIQNKFGGKCFIKSSTRSPKDALTSKRNPKMERVLLQELNRLGDSTPSDNEMHIAFLRATRAAMLVTKSSEAIQLLITSSRIYEDICRSLQFPEDPFPLNLILREWIEIDPMLEFRCFVSKGEMTALSQYCYYSRFPALIPKQKSLTKLLFDFWKQNESLFPTKYQGNYVVDFAISAEDKKVYVVELNPFFGDTSGCLFDWRQKDDVEILKNGPFESRFLEEEKEKPLEVFSPDWVKFMKDFHEKKRKSNYRRYIFLFSLLLILIAICELYWPSFVFVDDFSNY